MLFGYLFGYKCKKKVDFNVDVFDYDKFELNSESELGSDNNSVDNNSVDNNLETKKEYYFFEHLEHVKESYWVHFKHSITFAFLAAKSSFFFIVHAFWPDLFQTSGSDTIFKLTNKMTKRDG